MKHHSGEGLLNIGTGQDITIAAFARLIAEVVDYRGEFVFDTSRPDGAPQKLLDISKLAALGWRPCAPSSRHLTIVFASGEEKAGARLGPGPPPTAVPLSA